VRRYQRASELGRRPWPEEFAVALKGAFPALSQMRDEGVIKAWGIGVNTPEPILRVMQESDPDVCLLASQYSLIEHANALNNVFPVARQRDVSFVVGSSLNAGFISGSPRYNYGRTIGIFHRSILPSATGCAQWPTSSVLISEQQLCNFPQRQMSRFH
jgi:aryl-alcohol dehydrogenase-like predicted oxidoreductase